MKLNGKLVLSETTREHGVARAFDYANDIAAQLDEGSYTFDTPSFKYDTLPTVASDSEAELISLIRTLMAHCSPKAWLQAKSKGRRDAAVQAVLQWVQPRTRLDLTAASFVADQYDLCAILDQCLAAGVPGNCVKLRKALINQEYLLLYDQPKYAKFLDAVLSDRERQGLPNEEMFRYVTSS